MPDHLAPALAAISLAALVSGCVESKRRGATPSCQSDAQCKSGFACFRGTCLDPAGDEDGDALENGTELALGTDPLSSDSDADGADDATEVGPDRAAPLDSDGDQRIDALESSLADSDRDCVVDELDPDELGPPEGTVDRICSHAGICAEQGAALSVVCASPRSDVPPSWECDYSEVEGYAASDTTCDGVDDDCDGDSDEDYVARPTFCGPDACTDTGITSCADGVEADSCAAAATDLDATCNGVDDDCDGETDEDFEPYESTCGAGPCAASDIVLCQDGAEIDLCTPEPNAAPDDATCDGVDDDCDGDADDDFAETTTHCGVGACAAEGVTRCELGVASDTCVANSPFAGDDATCDGVDDDCDGEDDEDFAVIETSCGEGECAGNGLLTCVDGEPRDSCESEDGAQRDADCDDMDDDCDGQTDEDYASRATSCGAGACLSHGTTRCVAGDELDDCEPGEPLAADDATCDGVDDDCSGEADEDFEGGTSSCGTGACAATGTTACVGGFVQDVCTPKSAAPSDASCNAVDDDCNGLTDEDYVATATTCGKGACASTGTKACSAGQLTDDCTPGTPLAATDRTCDGVDDDCNGAADEDYVSSPITCGVGACQTQGTRICDDGAVTDACTPKSPAANDATCNNVDDDCSGQTDEDYVATTTACGVGACAATGVTSCLAGGVIADSCVPGLPSCSGRECGSDGCGGSCGTCIAPAGDPCVTVSCDATQHCALDVVSGCYIGGSCIAAGATNPSNPCEVCDPNEPEVWSDRPAGSPCTGDGDPCTDDVCSGGTCLHTDKADYAACDDGSATTFGEICVSGVCRGFDEVVETPFGTQAEGFVAAGSGTHRWGANALTVGLVGGFYRSRISRYGASVHDDSDALTILPPHIATDKRFTTQGNLMFELVDGAWTSNRDTGSLRDAFPLAAELASYPSYYRLRQGLPTLSTFEFVHGLGTWPNLARAVHRRCVSPVSGGVPTSWVCIMMGEDTADDEFGAGFAFVSNTTYMGSNGDDFEDPTEIRILRYDSTEDSWTTLSSLTHAASGRRLNDFREVLAVHDFPNAPTLAIGAGTGNLLFVTDMTDWWDIDTGVNQDVSWERVVPFQDRTFVLGTLRQSDSTYSVLASAPDADVASPAAWSVRTIFSGAEGGRLAVDAAADLEHLYLFGSSEPGGALAVSTMWRYRAVQALAATYEETFSGNALPAGWTRQAFCTPSDIANWFVTSGYLSQTGNCVQIVGAPADDFTRRGTFVYGPSTFATGTLQVAAWADDNDDFGIVYGVQDALNYYRVSFNAQEQFALLARFQGDTLQILDMEDFTPEMDVWYRVEIMRTSNQHTVRVNGVNVLTAGDATFSSGKFGLYASAMSDVRFDDLRIFPP